MTPSIGRIVHYRLPDRYEGGPERWRPAIVVQEFGELANLTVFLDGLNDGTTPEDVKALRESGLDCALHGQCASRGSAAEGTGVGEWRWPPRVS